MRKLAITLSVPLLLAACGQFQNPDAGDPVADTLTRRPVDDVIQCLTQEAAKHNTSFQTSAIPQGKMLDFGDSNIVKVRSDNGGTTYRFYAGKRHMSNLWLESAGKTCAS
ncbi:MULTISPECIES: hypothetical protein [Paraburkholderia]|uniref:Lipoprotein n=1 Tax=Paraburkholderia acidicola TaxID=1912599 RepID=A0A2A4EQT6_9BURK|nr:MULTISPECIES: hypothetical protein [Paraburkholderia]MCX4162349.1 hypothetical protein [Paraburkholderia megapolitana]MDN7157844.1 hypothetical protein [Paraburkholderia sp. CHISQ3]MDQ6494891.1 hypothetical protein [Paraburkholderia megapolitana]PCE22770.1 hypothetical protein BWP39_24115 [Paraburkholderia acidicola]